MHVLIDSNSFGPSCISPDIASLVRMTSGEPYNNFNTFSKFGAKIPIFERSKALLTYEVSLLPLSLCLEV